MSNKMITAAWEVPLPAHARLVLIALADSASEDEGVCWISNRTIMYKACAGKSTVGYILAAFERLGIAVRETRFEARKNGAQTSSIKRISVPIFAGTDDEIRVAKARFAAEYDEAYAWARSPKDTPFHDVVGGAHHVAPTHPTRSGIPHSTLCGTPPTTLGGTLEPSSYSSFESSSSSSLPPQAIEEEEGVILVPLDPYFAIPDEGMDGLSHDTIVIGVERLVSANAGDDARYRETLVREILSGGGRTISNIRRLLSPQAINPSRPRIGSNRGEPLLPPGINIFDLIDNMHLRGDS
jgi:ribosomal protein L35AE/L33A